MNQVFRRFFSQNSKFYTKTHEWIKQENGKSFIGISDHAQSLIGTMVHIDLKPLKAIFNPQQTIASIESVKSTVEVYTPCKIQILAYNEKVVKDCQALNEDAENQFIYEVKILDDGFKGLTLDEYVEFCKQEENDH